MRTYKDFICVVALISAAAAITSCGIRKKETSRHLEVKEATDSVAQNASSFNLTREEFGGSLKASFSLTDSVEADSAELESEGMTIKVKVSKGKPGKDGKPGKSRVDIDAKAKPTARSTLSGTTENKTQVKKAKEVILDDNSNKSVNRLSGWVWFLIIPAVVGIGWILISWAKKKLLP